MTITLEATYENGTLKLAQPLPLKEHEKVKVTIQSQVSPLVAAYGIMGWTGTTEELERLAMDPEFDPQEGAMNFADLVAGQQVFLDANTWVYHFGPHAVLGPACNQLVQRIENQELDGFTSTHVLTEVAHRMMMVEASSLPGWTSANVKSRLQKQASVIQTFTRFRKVIETILQSRIQVLTIAPALILQATGVSQANGLLSNDALLVAVMQANGLTNLASHDGDFDRVPGISRYAPV